MRILAWTLRIVLFLALFLFALKNTEMVGLRLYFDQVWHTPLILALLVFFVAGAAMGVFATMPAVFRQRREIGRLQRELRRRSQEGSAGPGVTDGDAGSQLEL